MFIFIISEKAITEYANTRITVSTRINNTAKLRGLLLSTDKRIVVSVKRYALTANLKTQHLASKQYEMSIKVPTYCLFICFRRFWTIRLASYFGLLRCNIYVKYTYHILNNQ